MLNSLKRNIVMPHPFPWPRKPDLNEILYLAILYITLLILTMGIERKTACAMASRKYKINEDMLLQAVRAQPWY